MPSMYLIQSGSLCSIARALNSAFDNMSASGSDQSPYNLIEVSSTCSTSCISRGVLDMIYL